jgi:hypothetical protein
LSSHVTIEVVATVYLDQSKWIDLSRAAHGRADGERFRDALAVARHSRDMGLVEFPLSVGHYIETWRRRDGASRARLAQTMMELARGRTLARPPDLCDNELDEFIGTVYRTRSPRPPWPPLGWGFPHASAMIPDLASDQLILEHEERHLAHRPDGFIEHGHGHRDFADLYRDGERGLAERQKTSPLGKDMDKAIIAASAVMEIHENIGWALDRAGLPIESLGPIGVARPDLPADQIDIVLTDLLEVAEGFIAELPTRDAALQLRLRRHQNPNAKWESNDMIDIAYLACAVVHCDIVVTEKQWVHELRESGLLDKHATRALHDVAELPRVLVEVVR